jgi:hypothetical protein
MVISFDGMRTGVGDDVRDPLLPDLYLLEDFVRGRNVRLVIVDPLMAFLGDEYDAHKDQDIRRALRPLRNFAERLGVTVLLLRHLNKLNGGAALYRGGGSIGITGAARAALVVGRDPDEPARHVLAMNKINLGPAPRSLAYRIEPERGVARIGWEGECDLTRDDILWHAVTKPPQRDRGDRLEDALRKVLPPAPPGLDFEEVVLALDRRKLGYSGTETVRKGLSQPPFRREGTGRRGNPFTYWCPQGTRSGTVSLSPFPDESNTYCPGDGPWGADVNEADTAAENEIPD